MTLPKIYEDSPLKIVFNNKPKSDQQVLPVCTGNFIISKCRTYTEPFMKFNIQAGG